MVFYGYGSVNVDLSRSCRLQMFFKIGALKYVANFTEKHLCHSIFFNKVADLRPATLLKKTLRQRCSSANFGKFFRAVFFTEHPSGCFCLFTVNIKLKRHNCDNQNKTLREKATHRGVFRTMKNNSNYFYKKAPP